AFIAIERWKKQPRLSLDILVLVGLSGLVALAALEEVSWFQRVMGFASPEFFQTNNRQLETNLHNMVVGGVNLHKDILVKVIFIVGSTHSVTLQLVARAKPAVTQCVDALV